MDGKRKRIALAGGLFGLLYLLSNGLLLPLELPAQALGGLDLVKGFLVGLGLALIGVSLLPEAQLEKLRKWKHRGE